MILSYPTGRNSSIGRDLLPEGKVGTYDRSPCSRRTLTSTGRGSISCESCKLCRFQIAPWMTPMGSSSRLSFSLLLSRSTPPPLCRYTGSSSPSSRASFSVIPSSQNLSASYPLPSLSLFLLMIPFDGSKYEDRGIPEITAHSLLPTTYLRYF